eukprot:6213110-Pleurochrysis_carterae.AAC.2
MARSPIQIMMVFNIRGNRRHKKRSCQSDASDRVAGDIATYPSISCMTNKHNAMSKIATLDSIIDVTIRTDVATYRSLALTRAVSQTTCASYILAERSRSASCALDSPLAHGRRRPLAPSTKSHQVGAFSPRPCARSPTVVVGIVHQ